MDRGRRGVLCTGRVGKEVREEAEADEDDRAGHVSGVRVEVLVHQATDAVVRYVLSESSYYIL